MIQPTYTKFASCASAKRLLRGASIAVLSSTLMMGIAHAQDAPEDDEDVVVTTGIRQSLIRAQDIKRNADSFVDAITAEDIGALPDRSVSEALQRVPGVSVLRFAAPDDPDHFSVEGSGVTIRGLPFVRSELNGRDVFAAGPSGQLGFQDVSPELLGSVQVFKNQSADLVEGGLSGTVDLRTRLPFDQSDSVFAYTLEGTFSDLSEAVDPSFSALGSNRWSTGIGEIGVLASFSRNRLTSRSDATQLGDFRARDLAGNRVAPEDIDSTTVFAPTGGGVRTQDFDRRRDAVSLAAQWESNDGRWQAAAQFLQSDSGVAWTENVLESSFDDNPAVTYSGIGGQGEAVFGSDGLFQSGRVTDFTGWRGPNDILPAEGIRQLALTRERVESDTTRDFGFNLKFAPNDRLRTQFDVQYIDAKADVNDVTVHSAFEGVLDITLDGDDTTVDYVVPAGEDANFYDNPANYYLRSKMDHVTQNEADSLALRADVEYDLDKGWLSGVRVGARYAKRDSLIQESTFNWGNISEIWTGGDVGGTGSPLLTLDNPAVSGLFGPASFENFQRNGGSANQFPGFFYQGPLASDYEGFLSEIQSLIDLAGAESRGGFTLVNRPGVVPGTPFLPSEIGTVETETFAAYARLDFGNQENRFANGMYLDGNIGARIVNTDVISDGSVTVLTAVDTGLDAGTLAANCQLREGQDLLPGICGLSDARIANLLQFFSGDDLAQDQANNSYTRLLPSLNLRLHLNDDMLIRLGAARSLSRPNENNLRAGQTFALVGDLPEEDPNNPGFNTFRGVGAFGNNPLLDPVMSNQFDASFEWYFGDANSFTVSGFYKEIEDLIIETVNVGGANTGGAGTVTDVTNNGATETVTFFGTDNADTNAEFLGFEVAYQQFYDFLPGALSNLGVQANYTYIDASSPGEFDNSVTGNTVDGNEPLQRDGSSFEQVSKHQFNVAGIYEDDKISARLAYNWRDDFLLIRRDVIFPFSSIFQKATGQLDGSVFYTINDNFRIGVSAVNLLDDVTETEQLINGTVPSGDNVRAPRSFIRNDRRFTLALRANF